MEIKKLSGSSIIVIVLGCAAYVSSMVWQNRTPAPSICSADTKVCSDGTYVVRSGPNCDFTLCPSETVIKRSDSVVGIGQTITLDGVSITPLGIISDSRCPDGAECIQRGYVVISIKLAAGLLEKNETIQLGNSVEFSGKKVAFLNMTSPKKESLYAGIHSEYDFEFSVK